MRVEKYLTFTDHALWEVIVNGDLISPVASASAGAEGPIPHKTAEQKLARKNKLKAKSTLMLAIPAKHLLKFHSFKDAKSIWEAIKNRFGGNKESKKMQKTILKQNYENFAASSQEGLDKTYDRFGYILDADDLENGFQNGKRGDGNCYLRVKRFIKKTGRKNDLNNKETVGFDRTKVECYNCHRSGNFARECRSQGNQGNRNRDASRRMHQVDTSTTKCLVVQGWDKCGYDWSFQEKKAHKTMPNGLFIKFYSGSDSEVKVNLYEDSINQLVEALKEKDDLKLKLEKFKESSKNLTKLINSQISAKDKVGLGYDSQTNESEVVHSVFNSRESDVDDSPVNDIFKTGEGFHAVPPPFTGNYIPLRPDLSFAGLDDFVYKTKVSETETSISKTSKDIIEKPKTVRPWAPIIEEWDTDSDNDSVFRPKSDQTKPKFTKINFVKSGKNMKSVNKENTHRQVKYHRKSQSTWDNRRKWNGMMTQKLRNGFEFIKKACFDQGIFDSGCSRHMTGNKSFLTDYQEVDGGFVAFAGSPKGGKITGKGKIRTGKFDFEDTKCLVLSPYFKLLDESQVLLKVPRQNNMYSFDLKNVVPSGVEFKNNDMNQFCGMKGIKREFSVARTPQQNGVAKRKNRTLIEASRTMLADSLVPTTFWAEALDLGDLCKYR
ncbi:ribonuclease H-like domain-containing protein [Tanacetum coccineum]